MMLPLRTVVSMLGNGSGTARQAGEAASAGSAHARLLPAIAKQSEEILECMLQRRGVSPARVSNVATS